MIGPNGSHEDGLQPRLDKATPPPEPKSLTSLQEKLIKTPNGPTGYAVWIHSFDKATNGLEDLANNCPELIAQGKRYAELFKIVKTVTQDTEDDKYVFPTERQLRFRYKGILEAAQADGFSEDDVLRFCQDRSTTSGIWDVKQLVSYALGKGYDQEQIQQEIYNLATQLAGLKIAQAECRPSSGGWPFASNEVKKAFISISQTGELPAKKELKGRGSSKPRNLGNTWEPLTEDGSLIPAQAIYDAQGCALTIYADQLVRTEMKDKMNGQQMREFILDVQKSFFGSPEDLPLPGSEFETLYKQFVDNKLRQTLGNELPAFQAQVAHQDLQDRAGKAVTHLEQKRIELEAQIQQIQKALEAIKANTDSLSSSPKDEQPDPNTASELNRAIEQAKSL